MDADQFLAKPVIVVGSARSGTTILGELLEVHSKLFGIVEPRFTWRYGNDRKSDMLRAQDATPPVIEYIRTKFAQQVEQSGRERLLEKTPSNSLRLGFVDAVLPDCKFVHIIRNGVDSALSIRSYWNQAAHGVKGSNPGNIKKRIKEIELSRIPIYTKEVVRRFAPESLRGLVGSNVWGPRIPGIRELLGELDLLEVCALQWRTCVEAACHFGRSLPTDRYMEVKLEELNLDRFREILSFAELEEEDTVISNFQEKIDPNLSTGRKSKATPAELDLLNKWITPTMHWLGYSDSLQA